MELIAYISEQEPIEIKVTKMNRKGSLNDYQLKHPTYKAFQFDGYKRPSQYLKEYVEGELFNGYLIGKGSNPNVDCYIKIKNYGVDV